MAHVMPTMSSMTNIMPNTQMSPYGSQYQNSNYQDVVRLMQDRDQQNMRDQQMRDEYSNFVRNRVQPVLDREQQIREQQLREQQIRGQQMRDHLSARGSRDPPPSDYDVRPLVNIKTVHFGAVLYILYQGCDIKLFGHHRTKYEIILSILMLVVTFSGIFPFCAEKIWVYVLWHANPLNSII